MKSVLIALIFGGALTLTVLAEGDGIQNIWAISVTGGDSPPYPYTWEDGSETFESSIRRSLGVDPLCIRAPETSSMRLEQDIKDYIADADEDDVILFAYVGHGNNLGLGNLNFTDCGNGDYCSDIAFVTLLQWLHEPGSHLLLFLNSCESGGLDEAINRNPRFEGYLDRTTIFSATSGTNNSFGVSFITDCSEILAEEMADGEMSYFDFVNAFDEKYQVLSIDWLSLPHDWGQYTSDQDFSLLPHGTHLSPRTPEIPPVYSSGRHCEIYDQATERGISVLVSVVSAYPPAGVVVPDSNGNVRFEFKISYEMVGDVRAHLYVGLGPSGCSEVVLRGPEFTITEGSGTVTTAFEHHEGDWHDDGVLCLKVFSDWDSWAPNALIFWCRYEDLRYVLP